MPKDNTHHDGAEHRDIHNLYGTMYHEATAQGLISRGTAVHGKDGDRPFVLSRAFFAGTQVSGTVCLMADTGPLARRAADSLPSTRDLGRLLASSRPVGGSRAYDLS